jgi:hypothetical protein
MRGELSVEVHDVVAISLLEPGDLASLVKDFTFS